MFSHSRLLAVFFQEQLGRGLKVKVWMSPLLTQFDISKKGSYREKDFILTCDSKFIIPPIMLGHGIKETQRKFAYSIGS